MQLIDIPALWHVRLTSGDVAHVWADALAEENGEYVFQNQVRATVAEQVEVEVAESTPVDPERVLIVVTRLPGGMVESIHTADRGAYQPGCACPDPALIPW